MNSSSSSTTTTTSASCNNCGKIGHLQHQCKMPIVSTGVVVFRETRSAAAFTPNFEYLMICRKDSLGYVDFLRGKYSAYNKPYLMNMFVQMTVSEKQKLSTWTFDALWQDLWHANVDISGTSHLRGTDFSSGIQSRGYEVAELAPHLPSWKQIADPSVDDNDVDQQQQQQQQQQQRRRNMSGGYYYYSNVRRNEDIMVRERFRLLVQGVTTKTERYDLQSLIADSTTNLAEQAEGAEPGPTMYTEPEWGFPKGRKNFHERDLQCALREFEEETGYSSGLLCVADNICPFEEIFTGSNYKSYKHKYYLAHIDTAVSQTAFSTAQPQKSEVSNMKWCSLAECLSKIRPYNIEKKKLIQNIDEMLRTYTFRTCVQ